MNAGWQGSVGRLICSMIFLLAVPSSGWADVLSSAAPATCADLKSDFSGIPTLTYATVMGDEGAKGEVSARLHFHPQHPSKCASPDEGACKGKAYIVPGDTVAIGASCNGWDYVQYLGEKNVTTGWVDDSRLGKRKTPKQVQTADEGNPNVASGYHFQLTKGQGTPVCEAYLQRLNETNFDNLPFCGRPENTDVPGFSQLQRAWVSTEEVNQLWGQASSVLRHEPLKVGESKRFDNKKELSTFRYSPPIDISNQGSNEDVVVWDTEDRNHRSCGRSIDQYPYYSRTGQVPLIVKPDNQSLDIKITQTLFGNTHYDNWMKYSPEYYRPIGESYGFFKFKNKYYFDTFFDNFGDLSDFEDSRRNDDELINTLGAFINENGSTREVCEYYVQYKVR